MLIIRNDIKAAMAREEITQIEMAEYLEVNPRKLSRCINGLQPFKENEMHSIVYILNEKAGQQKYSLNNLFFAEVVQDE